MPLLSVAALIGLFFAACGVYASTLDSNLADLQFARGNASFCCSLLHSRWAGRVSFAGHADYDRQQTGATTGYWSLQEAELRPACRVTPMSAPQVAAIVGALAQWNCTFAIRGGGHTSWAGAANIGGQGLTIDLSAFKSINVSSDRKVVSVGAGNRWLDIYNTLDVMGLAVSGGRVGEVGVGGLTLGGGKSFFSSLYGFACDNVLNYELVTGQGQILQVNHKSYPNLFKALKGGSNNFGIVTHFDLAAFEQGNLWGGEVLYPASQTAAKQYQALYNFAAYPGNFTNGTGDVQVIFAYSTSSSGQFFANFYSNTLPEPWPAPLAEFQAIQPRLMSTDRVANLSNFSVELGTGTPNGLRYLFGTLTFRNNLEFYAEVQNITDKLFLPLFKNNTVPSLAVTVVFQPLTPSMLRQGCGENSFGLCPSDGDLVVLDLTIQWKYAKNNTIINQLSRTLINQVSASAQQKNLLHPYIYLNYALKSQDPIASYGARNVANMKAMSAKFDPMQVFQRLVPGGFKL